VMTDVVRAHLEAAWNFDWDALRNSLSDCAQLVLRDAPEFDWDISGLYRHITQAWDFLPGHVDLSDRGDGLVDAEMYLTNGPQGRWAKKVSGEYRVSGQRIDRIVLSDSLAFEVDEG
jgi:hypothetical protein